MTQLHISNMLQVSRQHLNKVTSGFGFSFVSILTLASQSACAGMCVCVCVRTYVIRCISKRTEVSLNALWSISMQCGCGQTNEKMQKQIARNHIQRIIAIELNLLSLHKAIHSYRLDQSQHLNLANSMLQRATDTFV